MKRLFINNTEIDIDQNESITLNFQCANIGEFKAVGSGSQTIKIPMTAKNNVFFNSKDVDSDSVFPYLIHGARYYEDETLLIDDGNFYVLAVNSVYECCLTWGNAPYLKKAEEIRMYDVDLGLWSLPTNATDLQETAAAESCIYYVKDETTGKIEKRFATLELDQLYVLIGEYTRPHVYLKNIINGILDKLKVSKNILNSQLSNEINNIVLPQIPSEQKKKYNALFKIQHQCLSSVGNASAFGTIAGLPDDIVKMEYVSIKPQKTNGSYYVPEDGMYDIKMNISYSQPFVGADFWLFPDNSKIIKSNSANIYFHIDINSNKFIFENGQTINVTIDNIFYFDRINALSINDLTSINHDKGRALIKFNLPYGEINNHIVSMYSVFLKQGYYNFTIIGDGTGGEYVFKTNTDISISRVHNDDISVKFDRNIILNHNWILASKTLKEILQGIMQALGLMMQQKNGVVELYTPLDVRNRLSHAKNWSKKLVSVTKNDYKALKFEKGIGKINYLKWKSEEMYSGYCDGSFVSNSIKDESTYIENKVFSACEGYAIEGVPYLAFVNDNKDGELEDNNVNPKMLYLTGETINNILVNAGGIDFNGYPKIKRASINYFKYDNPNGIRKYIQPLLDSLNKVKIVTCTMVLTPTDIENLDFKDPIYLEQFGQYFMLLKVGGYKYKGTCDVELLKLEI